MFPQIPSHENISIESFSLQWETSQSNVWTGMAVLGVFYVLYSLRDYFRIVRFILTLGGPPTLPLIGNAYLATDKTREL